MKTSVILKTAVLFSIVLLAASCSSAKKASLSKGEDVYMFKEVQVPPTIQAIIILPPIARIDPRDEILDQLRKYVNDNVPVIRTEYSLLAEFVIEKDGTVSQVTVTEGQMKNNKWNPRMRTSDQISTSINNVANFIRTSTWNPGMHNDQPARVFMKVML